MAIRWWQRPALFVAGLVLLGLGAAGLARGADDANRYVGADRCRNCHSAAAKGDQYGAWTKMKHAAAFPTLASEAAKKIAAAKKIDNPQQSADCLRCHVTASAVPAEQKHKRFDPAQGVQCESCHGPGGRHVEARLAAEEPADPAKIQTIGKDEIVAAPTAATCKQCHNEQSPSYKPFSFRKMAKEIAHLDPRKPRPADYFEKLEE